MENYLPVVVHEEFAKRMEDEHRRQNHRIGELEKTSTKWDRLLMSVEKMATNMELMQKEQVKQREEIEELKGRDGEKWRTVTEKIALAIVGAVVGYFLKHFGL